MCFLPVSPIHGRFRHGVFSWMQFRLDFWEKVGIEVGRLDFPATIIHAQYPPWAGHGILFFFRVGPHWLDSPCFVPASLVFVLGCPLPPCPPNGRTFSLALVHPRRFLRSFIASSKSLPGAGWLAKSQTRPFAQPFWFTRHGCDSSMGLAGLGRTGLISSGRHRKP